MIIVLAFASIQNMLEVLYGDQIIRPIIHDQFFQILVPQSKIQHPPRHPIQIAINP